ncbi:MAG: transcription antitermination factor NusB [Actinomycetota bacterium]
MSFPPPKPSNAARRAKSATAPGVAARLVAFDLLRAVHEEDAYANLVLPKLLKASTLDERDRGLAAELGYGTLRAEGTLDHVIAGCTDRPLADIDSAVLDVLRLGVYQLLRTRVGAHAAVSTSVDLTRTVVGEGASKFVNAVLRKAERRGGDLQAPDRDSDPLGHLAITYAHPKWIVSAFRDALGGDLDQTEAALAAGDARPEVHLVARPGRITRAELIAACADGGYVASEGPWSPYAVRLAGGDVTTLQPIRDGRAGVQDEGSQLAALVASRATAGGDVLDLCAGPGGKAALLAGMLRDVAGRLVAVEQHAHRAELVRRSIAAATAGSTVSTVTLQADSTTPAWPAASFDGVLLDAPCTGLGALRRRPEARWRRQPGDVPQLGVLQRALLASAIDATKAGGRITYVVCSPHLAEGRVIVGEALKRRDDVSPIDVRDLLGGVPKLGPGPSVQLWPHLHGTDAMFVAVLERRSL